MSFLTRKNWYWFAICYIVLMTPVAVVFGYVFYTKNGEVWTPDLTLVTLNAFFLPVIVWFGYVAIWYLGALNFFVLWKYAELVQFITRIPLGRWFGKGLARDRFLRHAPKRGPYGWLYRKVTEVYPISTDDHQGGVAVARRDHA